MRFDCEQEPIEWSTVAAIVEYFRAAAARGHLGLYCVQFLRISCPAIISVLLGLLYRQRGMHLAKKAKSFLTKPIINLASTLTSLFGLSALGHIVQLDMQSFHCSHVC